MKYFKFTQISEETGISWAISQPISGPSYPTSVLPGLRNFFQLDHDPIFFIGECDDTAQENPENYIFEITFEDRAKEMEKMINHKINQKLSDIHQEEKNFRQANFSKYDGTATIAGIYKYEQAKDLLINADSLAVDIRQEASIRNIDVIEFAKRIVKNHEDFRDKEVKIAGIRGLIQDRLNAFKFDLEKPDDSMKDFYSMEKIGEEKKQEFEEGEMVEKIVDVMVGKYDLAFVQRLKFLS